MQKKIKNVHTYTLSAEALQGVKSGPREMTQVVTICGKGKTEGRWRKEEQEQIEDEEREEMVTQLLS